MSSTLVNIKDDDRGVSFELQVEYTYQPATAPRMGWRDGGSAGEGSHVEIDSVEVVSLVTWIGDWGVDGNLASLPSEALRSMNDEVARDYRAEIEAAVMEECDVRLSSRCVA